MGRAAPLEHGPGEQLEGVLVVLVDQVLLEQRDRLDCLLARNETPRLKNNRLNTPLEIDDDAEEKAQNRGYRNRREG